MEYLGLIYRNDLNIMYVKGYMKINLERIVGVDEVEGNQISELLKLVSPFQYTSEYLFIVFESLKPIRAKKGVKSVDFVDVRAVIPLDKVAMEELKISFNHNIRLVEPRWASEVEDFSQELFMENMRRGAICCLQMLNKLNKRISIDVFLEKWTNDENLIVRFINFQYRKEKLDDGNSTIWQYLLMYERHEPYPDTCLGYFFDSVHVFANWHYKKVYVTLQRFWGRNLYRYYIQIRQALQYCRKSASDDDRSFSDCYLYRNIIVHFSISFPVGLQQEQTYSLLPGSVKQGHVRS